MDAADEVGEAAEADVAGEADAGEVGEAAGSAGEARRALRARLAVTLLAFERWPTVAMRATTQPLRGLVLAHPADLENHSQQVMDFSAESILRYT